MLDLDGYEIRGLLGAGGMGEVHRAYDKRLRREVAIKRLPQAFSADPDRVARFEREARILASLNHPNIAAIHGIEDASPDAEHPSCALILELVEGPTLGERIQRGPLEIAEAVTIAIQIARALEAAHESGIVHRDLKPANIKITPQGTVKVLDFGIATSAPLLKEAWYSHSDLSTMTVQSTQPGTIVGTPSYMSPEQARGLPVDRRTDVWAFGCVLFEMLTGKSAFSGATTSDIVAKVLEREPDWPSLPEGLPQAIHRVLRWALAKEAHRRLRHLGDAILELEEATANAPLHHTPPARRRWLMTAALVGAAMTGLITGAFSARWLLQSSSANAARATSRFAIPVAPFEVIPQNVAISPDGRYIAYLAGPPDHQKTYLRRVDDRESRVISEVPMQAPQPFFSPDSQWVAFFDANKLKKMPVEGGSSIVLAEAATPRGGTWIEDGSIVFAPVSRGALMWIPANGGSPQALTSPDQERGETSHRHPVFVPQSRTVLFVAESGPSGRSLQAVSLDTKAIRIVNTGDGIVPRYVPSGHLAQLMDGRLVITPFDANALRFTGKPVTVLEDVSSFSFSNDGTLVYSEASDYNTRLSTVVWTSRDGSTTALPLPPGLYDHPRISADGRQIVMHRANARAVSGSLLPASGGLWLYDIIREVSSPLTDGAAADWPLWTADGTRVIYGSNRAGTLWDIMVTPVDGSGRAQELLTRPLIQIPRAASPTGDALVYQEQYADRPSTLWWLSLRGPGEPRPLFGAGAGEMMPTFSPDGRWIGYVSKRSGRDEVYVRSSTGEGSIWPISNAGGVEPVWSADGREIYYRADDKMMVVDVVLSPAIAFGKPHVLFEGSYLFGPTESQGYDVSRDGRRFLMLKPTRPFEATPLNVIVNWFDDLRRRVPTSP